MTFLDFLRTPSRNRRFHRHEEEAAFEQHEHHHHRGSGKVRGRHGRVFAQGDLRLLLLHLIAESPRHGYELIRAIEEALQGTYTPSPGVIYPTLTLLEEMGYIRVDTDAGEGNRKRYSITAEGYAHLHDNKSVIDHILARMRNAGEASVSGRAPQIIRATENLKLALRLRTSRGALDTEQLNQIAQILDDAARAIDRL